MNTDLKTSRHQSMLGTFVWWFLGLSVILGGGLKFQASTELDIAFFWLSSLKVMLGSGNLASDLRADCMNRKKNNNKVGVK